MPSTHHSVTARWVGLEGLSCEALLQRFTDKQRRRIHSKRVLGLDACGNPLNTLIGLDAYTQLHSLSVARCRLDDLSNTVLPASLRHLDISGNALKELHGVEQLVFLTWLDASSNSLQSAALLAACSQLCVLDLAQNQLTTLDGLEGLMALQSLDISGNCIEEELEVRTLAALPALRHLALAGNPVMADMDPREQRVFIVDLMPGKHSNLATCGIVTAVLERQQSVFLLDGLALSSNVSAHLHQARMAKLGRVLPHVFTEELLFDSPDAAETPVVRIKHAPESAVKLAQHHQQQQLQQQLLQGQVANQLQPQRQAAQPQLHQSILQSQQQLPQQLRQQLDRPASAPGKPQVAFGHKADWDLSTGSRKADGQLKGKTDRKPVRLTGQALAHLGNTDWGNLRTEVPVNRHVTLEHVDMFAHHALPFPNAAERQSSAPKGRHSPDTAAGRRQSPNIARSGKLVNQNRTSLQQMQLPGTVGQALGSAASSPRSLSPNGYLARSGNLNPSAAQPRPSSPLSRPGMVETLCSPRRTQKPTSSPAPRLSTNRHVTAQSASHGNHKACRGRPVLTWQTALEEVRRMDQAKPNFMQSLRTRSLSPQTQGLQVKSVAVNQPVWQQYQRHTTPDRVSARAPPIRRGFHGLSATASGRHSQQGRAFAKPAPEAGPSGQTHVLNQAPSVMSHAATRKSSHKAPAKTAAGPLQAAPEIPWSPAGKALAPRASRTGKPSQPLAPCASGRPCPPQQEGALATEAGAVPIQPHPSRAGATPRERQPIRAGQQALAALLAKQAAWQQTRSTSLPPVLSQITALLRRNPEPTNNPPARSAHELLLAADPQLGQQKTQLGQPEMQSATAVERAAEQWASHPEAAAVVASSAVEQPALQLSASSCILKPEYRVSFAEQIRSALEYEAQHAKHGMEHSRGSYFQGDRYFQETAGALKRGEEAAALHDAKEEAVLCEVEEEERPDASETVCGAAETCSQPSSSGSKILISSALQHASASAHAAAAQEAGTDLAPSTNMPAAAATLAPDDLGTAATDLAPDALAATAAALALNAADLAPDAAALAPSAAALAPDAAALAPGAAALAPDDLAPAAATLLPDPAALAPDPAALAPDPAALAPPAAALALDAASMGFPQADKTERSPADICTVQSLSSCTEAVCMSSLEGRGVLPVSTAEAAKHGSSSAESAADFSVLDGFLHTITTADDVLNHLLGGLSMSSSSSSAQIFQQSSSSAMPDLAMEQSTGVTADKPDHSVSAIPADLPFQSSSSVQRDAAAAHASSSSAALHSHMSESDVQSHRPTTDEVLDTLLEDLRSAELARQSSSSVLVSSLTGLAEMRRRSASSSPVAGSNSHHQPASFQLPVAAASAQAPINSSGITRSSSSASSSSPSMLEALQELDAASPSVDGLAHTHIAAQGVVEQSGQSSSAAAVVEEEEGDEEEQHEEEWDENHRMRLHSVSTSDAVPREGVEDGRLAPELRSIADQAFGEVQGDSGSPAPDFVHHVLSSSSLLSAVGMQRASSSAGLGKADSADASLEALLAELSCASATAAAALAPFTSSGNAQHAAAASTAASSDNKAAVQSPVASSSHMLPATAVLQAALSNTAAANERAVAQSPNPSSSQMLPAKAVLTGAPNLAANRTVDDMSQPQTSQSGQVSKASAAAAAPSSSPLYHSSSALLGAALSASPSSSSPRGTPHGESQFVSQLQGEFQQHMGAFDDDLAFIREVHAHQTLAAGMNPSLELQVLHKRFNSWKFDFKVGGAAIGNHAVPAVL
ncbi:hypothetical protein ABBQ38_007722 [Trebouxia sp. C0009 RCD-2024]